MALTPNANPDLHLRDSLVTASRDAWKTRLIDLSRRNNLLFYRPLVNGTLELPISSELTDFLSAGRAIPLSDLLAGEELSTANIRTITRKGLENLEEKGLSTLFLALGRCSWTAEDGGRDPFAPILLFPVTLKFKGHDIQFDRNRDRRRPGGQSGSDPRSQRRTKCQNLGRRGPRYFSPIYRGSGL